jgi:hypothetical protein
VKGETSISGEIPKWVSEIIAAELWSKSDKQLSFCKIFSILREHGFRIMEGVDSAEVSAFSNWVEAAERPDK